MKHREIKSYVCRDTRLSPQQEELWAALWPRYELTAGMLTSLVQQKAPLVVEIGFGYGDSFYAFAKETPQWNFIGVEVYRVGVAKLLAKLNTEPLSNVYLYCGNAPLLFKNLLPENSVDRVQIYFPDPWPKRRHHKRRLIQPNFVELIASRLKPNGIMHLATDWDDYAEGMKTAIESTKLFGEIHPEFPRLGRIITKYEQKAIIESRKIHELVFQRV